MSEQKAIADSNLTRGDQSTGRTLMIWLAANLVVTTLLTGTLFVPGVSFGTALSMIFLGTVVGMLVLVTVGNIGTRTGLATMAITRGSFGINGSLLPVAANIVILMGWGWVQAMLAGLTLNALVEAATGFSNPVLFAVLCQIVVVLLAIFGHTTISKVEPYFAVVVLLVMAFVFYQAFSSFNFGDFFAIPVDPQSEMTPFTVFDIVAATAISWTVLSADMNRYSVTTRASVLGSGVGYTLSTVTAMSLGLVAFSTVIMRGGAPAAFDPTVLVSEFGWGLGVAIFLSVMATNTMVVYGMATSASSARSSWKISFRTAAIVLGVISVIGSTWFALLNSFTDFLVMIGAFFVPVFAIVIVDYYILKRRRYDREILLENSASKYWYFAGINWVAFVTWIVGAGLSYYWTYVAPLSVGVTVPAFFLSGLLYFALMVAMTRPGTVFAKSAGAQSGAHLLDQ